MRVLIIPEGPMSSDRRQVAAGGLSWRDPIPLMFTDITSEGHDGAKHVGNVENLRRETVEGETWIVGDLRWDDDEDAREARRLAESGRIQGVSADLAVTQAEVEVTEWSEDGEPLSMVHTVVEGEIVGVTQIPMPAFGGARIETDSLVAALVTSADVSWFADPELDGPTPLTVTDDGRVYGHLATWGTCHIGIPGACVTPPEGALDYFHTGSVKVGDSEVAVGHITFNTSHPDLKQDAQAAARHYDHTGTVAADVAAGEDAYGIWVAGALREGVDAHPIRAAALSGDWRVIGGKRQLVAALAVNVPGFPIPRTRALVASGDEPHTLALVAAGIVEQAEPDQSEHDQLVSGDSFVTPDGKRIDPELVTHDTPEAMESALRRLLDQATPTDVVYPSDHPSSSLSRLIER